ncbi:helix-turn-helix domain-containing protein [Sphaerotilus sp.]|nr:helix-turn-helix domain-containing protein [Sphaerotilus sp.]MDZ7855060.1 helix-turn-helix domain-containing protein [Sphaerotilus sp.]
MGPRHKGSRAELARKLGISERSLYRKLRDIEG